MDQRPILLVEDNEDDIELTTRALQRCNIVNELLVMRDGAEALDFLFARGAYADRSPHEVPGLVLLDLKLPKTDGLDVLRQIRSNDSTKLVPVVILTASDDEKDLLRGYREGANSYIRKPISFDEFSRAVLHLGMYWLILNEPPPERKSTS